jgi:hypothetical protein
MKKLSIIIFFVVFAVVSACHKDSKVIPQDFYFRARKNNAGWGAVTIITKDPGDSLRISAFDSAGGDHLDIDIKFTGVGTYPIQLGQARYLTNLDFNPPTSEYRVDTNSKSSLNIISYDAKNKIITGTGNIFFLKNTIDYVQLTFSAVTFRGKLP